MVVRDQIATLRECLSACVGLIDHWVICDAGDAGGLDDLVRGTLRDIPGELCEREWIDFPHNRTELLGLARGKADYLLVLDANWLLTATSEAFDALGADAYVASIDQPADVGRTVLLRGDVGWQFVGGADDYDRDDGASSSVERLPGVSIHVLDVEAASMAQWERETQALEETLRHDPEDARAAFALAQTYRELGRASGDVQTLRRSAAWFRTRAEVQGWVEETYCAWLHYGLISAELGDWPEAVNAFTRAWQTRPTRLEAVHALASGFRTRGMHRAAHRFASLASGMEPLPVPSDLLCLEPWIYEWGLLFEYSLSAYWCEEYEASIAACRRLLANSQLPDSHRRQATVNMRLAIQASVRRAALAPASPPLILAPGTPTRGFRRPDSLTPEELRAPGLARRLAPACGMSVQQVDRTLLGLGPALDVNVARIAPWPLRIRPGTSDVAVLERVANRPYHLPPLPIDQPDLLLDLGAHIGLTAANLAHLYPTAHVVVVEPDAANLTLCEHNLQPVADRITLVGAAISTSDGSAGYSVTGDPAHHRLAADGAEVVSTITLETLFDHTAVGRMVDYIKMSLEGAEGSVLAATGSWPSAVRSISVVGGTPADIAQWQQALAKLGFASVEEPAGMGRAAGTRGDARPWDVSSARRRGRRRR